MEEEGGVLIEDIQLLSTGVLLEELRRDFPLRSQHNPILSEDT
jgi:hypothetical protein